MSEINSSVLSVSVALVVIGFVIKLAPFGKGQKAVKGVLSLIMVLVITAPLTAAVNIEPSIDIKSDNSETNNYSSLIENTTVNLLKGRIEGVLEENNLSYNYVDITVVNKLDKAEISAITVYVSNAQIISKIKSAVRNELQLDITVAVEKGR